ncbi:hypothetical protein [Paenarthrobacter nicotinovorans]|uniref:hypothetical protein n=1 Tax=Paenarthrobacter nicotinovorans TaxID=29320 RepID=UPI0004B59AD5|nr:hypothetical protein [Paenarthrobacter nicotinovorans]
MTEPEGFRPRVEDVDLRDEIDEGAKRWHNRAVAEGQERVLAWTKDGDLHSYRFDEITFVHPGVVAANGSMMTFASLLGSLTVALVFLSVVGAVSNGEWARLLVPVVFGLFTWLFAFWALQDREALTKRREGGVPEPKSGRWPVQYDVQWPPARMRGRGDASRL